MRLFEIKFYNHPFFKEQKIDFSVLSTNTSGIYTTVIIGPNGTGKSLLLREIIRIFKDLRGRKGGAYQKQGLEYKSTIRFFSDHILNEVINEKGIRQYLVNGKKANLYDWHFPKRIIALSSMFNDKFIFSKGDGFYKYAGTRSSNNNAGTKSIIKQIIESLVACDFHRIQTLNYVLAELYFMDFFGITYEARYLNSIVKLKNIHEMDDFFINWKDRTDRKTIPFSYTNYKGLSEEEKNQIINFLNRKITNKKFIEYNILENNQFTEFVQDYTALVNLLKLDLLASPEIFFKKDEYLSDSSISSGEYNLIFQFIRVMINVENDSLILIDEPETSLHPNWQIKYLQILRNIVNKYSDIHIIIATHSHLMITNLDPESTRLIKVTNENQYIPIEYNIAGWSPENILYNVFGITSFRNYYFELDIRKIIKFIETNEGDKEEMHDIMKHISSFSIKDNDPLKLIINEAKNKLDNERSN